MSAIISILKGSLALNRLLKGKRKRTGYFLQQKTLKKLLGKASETEFGKTFEFQEILSSQNIPRAFQQKVPVYSYNSMFRDWWHKTLKDESNICWPGKVKYFALSSGTSEDTSKRIPVTNEMLKVIMKTGLRQYTTLIDYRLPGNFFQKSVLTLGGSTDLQQTGNHCEGDLSGIVVGTLPYWMDSKPGKTISNERDWNTKLRLIAENAAKWDVGTVAGVPSWVQMLFEKIIDHHGIKHIHEIWPDFKVFVHGGVSFEPYKKSFNRLLGREVYFLETYLASEGFIAFQNGYNKRVMEIVLDNGIFFEFVPFNSSNFSADGQIVEKPEALLLDEVKIGEEYAILISTCSGAWRYLIGDTIKFASLDSNEIIISGRTKHFLSLCGEHLSIDNMNKAISLVADELNTEINEFTVAGMPYKTLFAHKWFIGTNNQVDPVKLKERLDFYLNELNDDYKVERQSALKEIFVEILPCEMFYKWLKVKGKEGAQQKFPRVLNKEQLEEWELFIRDC